MMKNLVKKTNYVFQMNYLSSLALKSKVLQNLKFVILVMLHPGLIWINKLHLYLQKTFDS